jgi:trimethylamine--corrinoid protein Co-methyltransferase
VLKGFTRRFAPLELLSDDEIDAIHRGALFVLETTGMRIEHDRALQLFADNDCWVDFEEKRVRIPASLAEECLRRCPSSYAVKARDRDRDLMIGGDTLYFMQGMGMKHIDLDTWETRPATADEHRDAMIVADALENVHLADGVFFYMDREGIPPIMVMLENLASGLRHSAKAEHFGYQKDCEIFAIEMAEALQIGLNCELDTAFPLTIYEGAIQAAFRYVEAGFPSCPAWAYPWAPRGPPPLPRHRFSRSPASWRGPCWHS